MDDLNPEFRNTPHTDLISLVKDRPGHDYRYAMNSVKIKNELGWVPVVTFDDGLRKTIRWYLENTSWWKEILHRN